jgi:hypothetical protein
MNEGIALPHSKQQAILQKIAVSSLSFSFASDVWWMRDSRTSSE